MDNGNKIKNLKMKGIACFILWFLVISAKSQATDLLISVNPETNMLVDSLGRERFFHGTNVVAKHSPYHPITTGYGTNTFSELDMQRLQSLGLNSVRLGMSFKGYVPEREEYNKTFINIMGNIVETSAKYGIYILLDMHQDSYSEKFCDNGMPNWMVNTGDAKPFPFPMSGGPYTYDPETGLPSGSNCSEHSWSSYYFTEAVAKSFQNLYSNVDGLRDDWADFWKKTAQFFKDYPNVIGYELMNEPFCGDIYKNPLLLVPGVADRLNLQPAYDALQKAIREVDEQHNIFFEGVTWDWFGVGFTKVPGGSDYQNRSVLSYHYYSPPDFSKEHNFEVRMKDLKNLKCGGFLTEMFTSGNGFTEMYELFDLADENKQSWQGWSYNHNTDTGSITVEDTSRTYPQAVAGNTISYKFDKDSKIFSFSYKVNGDCKSSRTEIYYNKAMHYSNGFWSAITPSDHVEMSYSDNGFIIYLDHDNTLADGDIITFEMTPASDGENFLKSDFRKKNEFKEHNYF